MTEPTRIGDIIDGKYRVERVLGRGGMGIVVAARHLRLGQDVAIKFPVARFSVRSDIVARLVREGRAAMRIRSEHVARVHDVGTLDDGEPYLVMEYLVGHDLGAVLAGGGPLPIATAVEYILQATEALAEAHARGIIHRDLKPSNLFLSRRPDGSPLVKVIDFGISKSENGDLDPLCTDPAAVIGSPLYMAPEQMRSVREVDARSDIWALGATLHTLVAGEPPFAPGTLVEIHERIVRGTPLVRAARPDAPAELEAALLRCMQRDPANRYASVADLADALAVVAPEHARSSALRARRILEAAPLEADPGPAARSESSASPAIVTPAEHRGTTATASDPSWGNADRLHARRTLEIASRDPDPDPLAPTELQIALAAAEREERGGATATASNPSWKTADRLRPLREVATSTPLGAPRRAGGSRAGLLAFAAALAVIALIAARGLRQTTHPASPSPPLAAISASPASPIVVKDAVIAVAPSSSVTAAGAIATSRQDGPKLPLPAPIIRVTSPSGRSSASSIFGGPRPISAAPEPPRAPPPDPLADPD